LSRVIKRHDSSKRAITLHMHETGAWNATRRF
jgi:hypothetical protein